MPLCCQPLIHVYYSDETRAPPFTTALQECIWHTHRSFNIFTFTKHHLHSSQTSPSPPLSLMIVAVRIYGIHLMSPFVIANMYVNILESLSKLKLPLPIPPPPFKLIFMDQRPRRRAAAWISARHWELGSVLVVISRTLTADAPTPTLERQPIE